MSSRPVIRAQALSKSYRLYKTPSDRLKQYLFGWKKRYHTDVQALADVSFSIDRGESVGVLGRNGSGKSTLLQILCGALAPSGGNVDTRGRIGTMLELGAGFNPEFTGRENVFLNARLLGMSEDEIRGRYPDIVSFADIGDFIDKPVRCYSSGMYVRLAFAVAAHTSPDILLIDEVLAVGDVFFQQKCNLFMQRRMRGVAKVLVTHSLETVASMTTRVLVFDRGRLVFDGPPLEGIEAYIRLARTPEVRVEAENETGACSCSGEAPPPSDIPPDKLSGNLGAVFTAFAVEVNDNPHQGHVMAGATVRLHLHMTVLRDIAHPIVGYLLADRFGNFLFGQNTLSAGLPLDPLRPGTYRISLSFTWPDIAAGDYFLTPGLGDGLASKAHTIVCWAHNIFHFSGVAPHKDVHGLFNGTLHFVRCRPVATHG